MDNITENNINAVITDITNYEESFKSLNKKIQVLIKEANQLENGPIGTTYKQYHETKEMLICKENFNKCLDQIKEHKVIKKLSDQEIITLLENVKTSPFLSIFATIWDIATFEEFIASHPTLNDDDNEEYKQLAICMYKMDKLTRDLFLLENEIYVVSKAVQE